MSLIDDAVACGARIHSNPLVPQVILDGTELARLRAMWLKGFRERAAQLCNSDLCACCWSEESKTIGELHAAAIRALPLDRDVSYEK